MDDQLSSTAIDDGSGQETERLNGIGGIGGVAFIAGGVLVIASLLAPRGVRPVTDRDWLRPLVIVGIAVLSVALGLLGLYRLKRDRSEARTVIGASSTVVAGVTLRRRGSVST